MACIKDLTAIVACKNRDKQISYCINSIFNREKYPRVILVDYGSDKPISFSYFNNLNIVRVKRNTSMFNKARALNIGIRRVKTKYLIITDADQIFAPNFFGSVVNTLRKNKHAFVMCHTHFLRSWPNCEPSEVMDNYGYILNLAKNSGIKPHGDGCCNGLTTAWAKKVRGYDESYIGYGGEDSDFALRAVLDGHKKVWIHKYTSMVHLPHNKNGTYYNKEVLKRNRIRYNTKVREKTIIANVGKPWGRL